MKDKIILKVEKLKKTYKIYNKHIDRLKETILPNKKYHKEFNALEDITFDVKKGEAIGILGRNGSGKSTLLKIITGVLSKTTGEVYINGRISAILELGTGFNPDYTGTENIYLNGTMMGYSKKEIDKKLETIKEFADIGDFINQPVKIYSSGMFARLAFAVAINVEPEILIIDEVLAVGDMKFQIKCINKMKELKEKGTTILFVSHATEQVKRFCNRAIWIKEGKLILDGESSQVVDIYEEYMKSSDESILEDKLSSEREDIPLTELEEEKEFTIPQDGNVLAAITNVKLNKDKFKTFDKLIVEVEYEIYQSYIEGFLLGVAIYTPNREYIFGPNTYLEKIEVPKGLGRHKIRYIIGKLPLLGGVYDVDVGIFTNEGLNCLDYKTAEKSFIITNKYISEGKFYINHNWEVIK